MMKPWTHRVVKRAHGAQGEMFDFPTAATFGNVDAALDYAAVFAAEQAAVGGAQIEVRTRAGGWTGHRGDTVAMWRAGRRVL